MSTAHKPKFSFQAEKKLLKSKIAIFLITLLAVSFLVSALSVSMVSAAPDVYVGVAIGYGWVDEEKALINKVSSYTNLVVVTRVCGTTTNESIQAATESGMYVLPQYAYWEDVYKDPVTYDYGFSYARQIYGNYLLGQYFLDEPGGKVIDRASNSYVSVSGDNFIAMTSQYEDALLNNMASNINKAVYPMGAYELDSPKFTSDYALQWFDYKAGYDVVLTEFIGGNNRQLQIALVRGAAAMMNKDWGVMISWDYTSPPYLESGADLYKDMVLAYNNGAKYIVVYDASSPDQSNSVSTLTDEHYQALQDFWTYIHSHSRSGASISQRTAYVMPAGYGFGFRHAGDSVWGLQDENSSFYYESVQDMLAQYGENLDVIYYDALGTSDFERYKSVVFPWDYDPFAQTPTATITDTITPTPTITGGTTDQGIPTEYLYAGVIAAVVVVVAVGSLMALKARKNRASTEIPPPPPLS